MDTSWANLGASDDDSLAEPGTAGAGGLDLHLELTGPRVRAALESALRNGVQTGRLPAGMRLPATRTLAADLGVARNTVAEAYGQLVAEGWLAARHGSGTWVAERAGPPGSSLQPEAHPVGRGARYDLRPGSPDLTLFPRPAWLAAARRALTAADKSQGFVIIDVRVDRDDLSPVTVKYIKAAARRSQAPRLRTATKGAGQ